MDSIDMFIKIKCGRAGMRFPYEINRTQDSINKLMIALSDMAENMHSLSAAVDDLSSVADELMDKVDANTIQYELRPTEIKIDPETVRSWRVKIDPPPREAFNVYYDVD